MAVTNTVTAGQVTGNLSIPQRNKVTINGKLSADITGDLLKSIENKRD